MEYGGMRARIVCDISQEQIDSGYDLTLIAIHRRFVEWLLSMETPITGYALQWHEMDQGDPHLLITADVQEGAPVRIDEEFFDEMHLGGGGGAASA